MSEWKPGDVAMVNARWIRTDDESERYAVRRIGGWMTRSSINVADWEVAGARPLVVIDPEDADQVTALANAWDDLSDEHATLGDVPMTLSALRMQAALREFANPTPRIEEPQGLGAVVEDAKGARYVRYVEGTAAAAPWRIERPADAVRPFRYFHDLNVVRVLSHGVTEGAS